MKTTTILSLILFVVISSANAVTIYVPEDFATIGDAVAAASDGDSILVGPGIYDPVPVVWYEPDNITLLGNGFLGDDRTTIIGSISVEEEAKIDLRYVDGWEIGGFELTIGKKGINTEGVNDIYIHDIYVHNVDWNYADGVMVNGNNILIERSIFEGCPYAGIEIWYATQSGHIFRNNTIVDCDNGILVRGTTSDLILENNIIAYNEDGVEFAGVWTGSEFLDYNDVYDNADDNWSGCNPGPNNISADPLFIGVPGAAYYMLQSTSPCIDAGNPESPLDPDSTIADIGCFYYDQNFTPGNLSVDLEPVNPPVIIPVEGGSFEFNADISCDSTAYAIFDAWTELVLPNGLTMGPFILRQDLFIEANGTSSHQLEMYVSMWAMPGVYELWGKVGEYPGDVWASDSFTFEKMETDGIVPEGTTAYGVILGWGEEERFDLPVCEPNLPDRLNLTGAPNPFNPETTLRFDVPQSAQTSLKVYDLSGRTVATLLDRMLEAGRYEATFDGSQLASGLYLAVLETNGQRTTHRLLLLK